MLSSFLKSKINLLALGFCGLSFCFWVLFLSQWYYFRYTGSWDTAFFIQTLWGIGHGSFSPSVLNANFLADHFHFLNFLLAPLYWLYPDPMLLQDIKILGFFGGAYLLFLILKKRLHPFMALGVMIAFTLAPANVATLRFAFSYEPFAILFIFLIFKAFDEKKYKLYIISCFLLMMVKEQMPLVVMGFGAFAFLFRKEDKFKWAYVPVLMGLAVFIVEVFVLWPYIRHQAQISKLLYWDRYFQFGKNPQEIVIFLITHPAKVWAEFFSRLNIMWYRDIFGDWGWVSFLSPHLFLPAVLIFLKMILSSAKVEHSVTSAYYACIFTPFIVLATWNTLNRIQGKYREHFHCFVLGLMFIHALSYMPAWLSDFPDPMETNLLATQKFINQIPSQASVLSSRKAMPYLANRKELYQLKDYFNGRYYLSGKKFYLPEDVDYVLVDFSEFNDRKYTSKLSVLNFGHRFKLQESIEDVALLARDTSGSKERRLIERSLQPFLVGNAEHFSLQGAISFEAIDFPKVFPRPYRIFPVTMYWKSLGKTELLYEVILRVRQGAKIYYEKHKRIGSAIYPTSLWRKGEYIKEDYFYLFPRLSPGEYSIEVQVYNPRTNQPVNSVIQKTLLIS